MKRPRQADSHSVRILPLTPRRWPDLEKLFGPRGACAGCWCMYWRLSHSQFRKQQGAANKRAFMRIVTAGKTSGLLAYVGREPVGWCAVAPRESFRRLEGSRVLAKVDEQPVWSIVCLYVLKEFRQKGISVGLLRGAAEYARKRKARIIEGYPIAPRTGRMPDAFAWTGLESAFRKAGFKEVARRSPTRPIMRHVASKVR